MMEENTELTLDKALAYLYQCSHDYQVWLSPYPDHYDTHDKEWFNKQKEQRYDSMTQAAKAVAQMMLNTHADIVFTDKTIVWKADS